MHSETDLVGMVRQSWNRGRPVVVMGWRATKSDFPDQFDKKHVCFLEPHVSPCMIPREAGMVFLTDLADHSDRVEINKMRLGERCLNGHGRDEIKRVLTKARELELASNGASGSHSNDGAHMGNGFDLVGEIRRCLVEGRTIAILGLHPDQMPIYQKIVGDNTISLRVMDSRVALPRDTALVIAEPRFSHTDDNQVKKLGLGPVHVRRRGEIKAALRAALDQPPVPEDEGENGGEDESPNPPERASGYRRPATPQEIEFAHAFRKACGDSSDCALSRGRVLELFRECWENPPKSGLRGLCQRGFLEPVVKEGQERPTSYKAGERLLEICTTVPDPISGAVMPKIEIPSSIAKILELIATRPAVLQRIAEIDADLVRLRAELALENEKLERIKRAEGILTDAENLIQG